MPAKTHGKCAFDINGKRSPTYSVWASMKARCHSPSGTNYSRYGGRGIAVCERWRNSFANFLADMGERPDDMSIERIDNDGNYDPANCRWATRKDQNRNTRASRMLTYRGETKAMAAWCEDLGLDYFIVRRRVLLGDTPEAAFEHGRRIPAPAMKYSDEVIAQVRSAVGSQKAIAQRFGMSQTYVGMLKRGISR